jgi:tripartite-type tricarboxylate transporter receptor subunit TctC
MGVSVVMVGALALPASASAASPRDILKNKNVIMYISSGAGGTNDTYARLIADHMSRHLPGKPKILPKNLPGAGGLKATKFLYVQAPRNGTVMGVVQRSVAAQPLLGIKGADFNPLEFNWIGSTKTEVSAAVTWNNDKVKTIEDAKTHELLVGSSGVGNDTGAFPRVVNYFLGTKLKPIHGYISGTDILLAMERGEVQARFGWSWGSVKSREPKRLKDGTIKVLLQMGLKKAPDLEAPLVLDLAKNANDRKAMEVIFAQVTIGWPSLLPPKVPADMVKAYRDAYKATMADKKFQNAVTKRRLELDPMSGEEIQAIIADTYASPPEVIALARKAYAPGHKIEMAKILNAKGSISKINKKGSKLTLTTSGKKVEARVAGRTKITIAGKKAKRKALKAGMNCSMSLVASGAVAQKITCQ